MTKDSLSVKKNAINPAEFDKLLTEGKLRYIPFETFWDTKNRKFFIHKYPVNYLTRISTRSIPNSALQGGVLAL